MTEPPPPDTTVSVVVIDDHRLLAESIAAGLSSAGGIAVVGIATTGAEGLWLVRLRRPDVCLLDQRLPDATGTDLVPALLDSSPNTHILLVTASDSDDVLRRALDVGCVGFLTKGVGVTTLVEAVRRAADGEIVLTANDLRRLIPVEHSPSLHLGNDLTPREREVLALLGQGKSTATISSELFLSSSTVRNHVQSVLTKLGAHSKLQAVTIALREGIVGSG
ncbi:MAG: response regulator transcription factor [bacterium]|nr:response regulator transcription factor [bacterium]